MKTYARDHHQAPARRSDADTGEGARERLDSAPVPRRAPSSDPAAALLAAMRARRPDQARDASGKAGLRALEPFARPLPPVLATGFPRIAAEALLRYDLDFLTVPAETPAPESPEAEREPEAAAEKPADEAPQQEIKPPPDIAEPEPQPEPERPEGKATPPGKSETPLPRGPQEFGRVAAGGNPQVPGPVIFERQPPLPAGAAYRPGDVPPEGEEATTRLEERVEAEKERFERAAEPLAEKPEAGQQEPEPDAVREPAGTPQPKAEGQPEPGAAPPAPPPGPPAADGKAAGPETPAKEKEAEALQKQAAAAEAAMQREAPQEPQSAEDVRALIAEGEPEAAGTAEPSVPVAGPAAELEQWKARAGAAAGNIPEPDLGPAEARTQGVSDHAAQIGEAQKQRREELPKEAQAVIKARKRDISELDQVPEALTKDDPANAVEGIKNAAQRQGLPPQELPNLQPTPKGYLPNLYGDPITPSQLAELREQYKDKLLPKDRQPPGYDEIAALKKALADDKELEGRIAVFGGQEISEFELPPKLEIAPIHQEDIAAVLARIVTEAEGLGKSWIEDARKTAYTPVGALVKPDAFPDLGNEWAPQEAEFLLGEMQRVAEAAGIAKGSLDQAIRDRQQQLAGGAAATRQKGEEVFKDTRDKVAADFQNTQGAIAGLRREWEDWADARAASIKGNVDWKAIRARQGELEKAVCDMANEWVVAYDDMAKQRARKLLQAMAGQKQAYEKAIAKDKEEDLEAAGEDAAKRKGVEDSQAYADWVKARMEPIKEQIQGKKGYISANTETVQKWQTKMREVRDGAVERLKQWADRQIGREKGWIDWILSLAGEWHADQHSEAAAFARQRAGETTEALGTNLQLLNDAKTRFGDTLDEDEKAQLNGLGAEQQAVIDTYYAEKGGGDTIGAVAAGLKVRLRGQRLPELEKAIRQKVLETPTNEPGGMRLVGLVKGMGEPDPAEIAVTCRSGFEHTWGTDEDKIFNALAKIRSKEGGKAVRAAYWNRYPPPEDFDTRLRDELAGGGLDDEEEYDKAKAQLELNKIDVAAADLRIAVEKWDTNEEKINEVLRGLDDEDRKKVIDAYETKYHESLWTRLDSELSGYEKDITFALFDGNKDKADAIELKQAQTAFWGPDKEQMEKVYQRISDEEWERGRSKELPVAEIEKNIKARKAKLGEEYKEKFKTTVDEDFKKTFQLMGQPVYADLMIGLQESKWTEVDAARVEIERNPAYSVYAEDKTINEKVLKAQYDRAYKNRLHDAELALQQEERTWTQANPDKPWNADYRRERQQHLAKHASEAAQGDSQKSMNALRTYYMKQYGGQAPEGFDEIIKDLTQGTGENEAVARLKSGGYLPPEEEIFYAVEGAGTDEDRLKATLKGKTKKEIEAIREAWNNAIPKRTDFDECILGELSGRDEFDVKMMLKYGEPTNPEVALQLAEEKLAYEGRTGGIEQTDFGPVKSERYRDLELQLEQLKKDKSAYEEARSQFGGPKTDEKTGHVYDHPQIDAYQNSWISALTGFNDTVDIHRQEVDAKADLISGIVAMVVAVVVGALLAPFTAGQSLWLIAGAAALVAATSAAAAMAVKLSIKGEAYGGDEMTMDLLFAGVDLIVSAATAGVGGKILKAGLQGGKTATEGAKKSFKQVIKEGWKRAGTKEAEKQLAHTVLTETAQGMFSTVGVPSFMDEYGKGMNPLANMVLSMGLSMGSGIALAKGINGISRLRPADFDFEAAARTSGNKAALVEIRGNPEKLGAMRSAYLDANPHKTTKDFLKDYDDLLLKQMKDVEVKAKWQHEARADMLQYVPQEHKARFSETPIEMLSEQEFHKRTRSKKGEAFVEIKDGKPTVFVKQGASETALRREAPHLLQSVDEKWQGHLKDLDEANLRNWNTKDTREKFRLYDRKLDVEIDSALRDLDLMRGQARTAVAMPSLQQEIEEVEETLRNLTKRRHEAGNIGPFRRTLMAWGGSLFEPQYLKQEPRLFSKTSTKRFTQRFRGRVAISTEAELRPDFYPQRSIARGLDLTSEKLHFQVHKASGGSGPSATLLRAVDPARPAGSPAPLVFVRKEKAIHFDLIDNRKLQLPPEPDGHFYRIGKSGEIELVPVGKHKGPFFELVDGAIQPRPKDANPIVLSPAETYSHSPRDWPVRDANPVPAAKPATTALAGPGGGGAKQTAPLPSRPPTSDDPLVAVKIRGQNKGEYWPEGSPQFKANAGTAQSGPDPRYVVLPKSEAEGVFRARPAGTKPDTAIIPRQRDGKLLESRGAGRTAAGREPKPGEQPKSPAHPISARTERKAVKGAPKGGDLEMAAPDPAAAHAFPRTIGADTKQAQGYNALLDSGELGLLRPGNISTGGVDAITVRIKDGKAEIFLNDFTTPGTAKPEKATHAKWHAELKNLMDSGRVQFDDKEIEDAIKRAFAENRVFVRPVRVDLPARAKPGPRPRAGLAEPALQLGGPIPFEK